MNQIAVIDRPGNQEAVGPAVSSTAVVADPNCSPDGTGSMRTARQTFTNTNSADVTAVADSRGCASRAHHMFRVAARTMVQPEALRGALREHSKFGELCCSVGTRSGDAHVHRCCCTKPQQPKAARWNRNARISCYATPQVIVIRRGAASAR